MMKVDVKSIILVIYLQVVLILYFWLIFPSLTKSKNLAPTEIPLLSISDLGEVNRLFAQNDKVWLQQPNEPNLSEFNFGQVDPI